jgi:hypothetical protein
MEEKEAPYVDLRINGSFEAQIDHSKKLAGDAWIQVQEVEESTSAEPVATVPQLEHDLALARIAELEAQVVELTAALQAKPSKTKTKENESAKTE